MLFASSSNMLTVGEVDEDPDLGVVSCSWLVVIVVSYFMLGTVDVIDDFIPDVGSRLVVGSDVDFCQI